MGNSCCNNPGKDQQALNYGKPEKKGVIDPALTDLLNAAKKSEGKIVKLQAHWKGH